MATELKDLKSAVEGGESIYTALENVNLEQMRIEGSGEIADKIKQVMALIDEVYHAAGIDPKAY